MNWENTLVMLNRFVDTEQLILWFREAEVSMDASTAQTVVLLPNIEWQFYAVVGRDNVPLDWLLKPHPDRQNFPLLLVKSCSEGYEVITTTEAFLS